MWWLIVLALYLLIFQRDWVMGWLPGLLQFLIDCMQAGLVLYGHSFNAHPVWTLIGTVFGLPLVLGLVSALVSAEGPGMSGGGGASGPGHDVSGDFTI